MKNTLRERKNTTKNNSIAFVLLRFVIVLHIAIFAGMISGNLFDNYDIHNDLQEIDIEACKSVVGNTLPMINYVYNNGNMNTSSPQNFGDAVKTFFLVDLYNPVTILDAQISGLYAYYESSKGENKDKEKADTPITDAPLPDTGNPGIPGETANNIVFNNEPASSIIFEDEAEKAEQPADKAEDKSVTGGKNPEGLQEAASSISMEELEHEEPKTGKVESDGKISIRNETKYKVDIDALMKEPLKFKFDKKKDKVLIYHTHTTESYIRSLSLLNSPVSTRSRDPKYNIVRVGEELAQNLRKSYGMQVVHNTTVHDYPDYNSSYVNALKTVTTVLKAYPSAKIVIDLHRDAIANDKKLREVAEVNGKNAAKIMFVVATGAEKQNHPNWKENFKLALKIQEKLNETCPQLTQPIFLSKYRFNQHVKDGALLIEIGGDGNLLEECLESTKYLAKAISAVVNN